MESLRASPKEPYIKTVSPLESWSFLRFWDYYYNVLQPKFDDMDMDKVLPVSDWFRALRLTPFEEVKCVILGQDPYPTPGHAMGLAFSVFPHVSPLPRSLKNIFREYQDDLGYPAPRNGDLTSWAKEGVLLLNTCLTVEAGKANSHVGLGWEKLTYEVVRSLGEKRDVVFVLWGKTAQEYSAACGGCHIISSVHPSPLSANKGFLGSRPFSRVNRYLGDRAINWRLT